MKSYASRSACCPGELTLAGVLPRFTDKERSVNQDLFRCKGFKSVYDKSEHCKAIG